MRGAVLKEVLGALTEAWEELVINRGRVILSLIGVAAAVWAMGTVMALGTMMVRTLETENVHMSGIRGTVSLGVTASATDDATQDPGGDTGGDESGAAPVSIDDTGHAANPVAAAARDLFEQTHATLASRSAEMQINVTAPGALDCEGYDDAAGWDPTDPCAQTPAIAGVDPAYFTIFDHKLVRGRLLEAGDGERQMNPVVVNTMMWERLGRPDITQYPRFSARSPGAPSFTVVGVVNDGTLAPMPKIYLSYDALFTVFSPQALSEALAYQTVYVAVPPEQITPASQVLSSALASRLGPGYTVDNLVDAEAEASSQQTMQTFQMVIGGIGAIVILIGALGLLTVSIVTIRQRVREIGIRRSMGASAKRIFFAVFLESVVATTVAGVVGVILSILTVRFVPGELLGYPDLSQTPYPLSSALTGLAIAAFVGALCGIIPASIAVRIKPIDAIRF
ncbi:ABC transporter permease [Nanchangia anserum]|uniref:ABC transporter permease n=1 Tax=Nanchangia anserum TaxID=2692125 RepID=A0A8I0GEE6_9ACTO|nr:FtsX-like permease family protein [Nanchangia anserum]MBD3689988.1 ABC transporter permease [Nanchangia anserum]QOX82211.1 ABC transporter permease [Nanchangia anserum]